HRPWRIMCRTKKEKGISELKISISKPIEPATLTALNGGQLGGKWRSNASIAKFHYLCLFLFFQFGQNSLHSFLSVVDALLVSVKCSIRIRARSLQRRWRWSESTVSDIAGHIAVSLFSQQIVDRSTVVACVWCQ